MTSLLFLVLWFADLGLYLLDLFTVFLSEDAHKFGYKRVDQDDHVHTEIESNEIQEPVSTSVPICRLWHIIREQKEHPSAHKNDSFVEDLDHVVDSIVHWHHGDIVGKNSC